MNAHHLTILALALALGALAAAASTLPRRPPEPPPAEAEATATAWIETATLRAIAKDRITAEVMAGRLTLLQAAALFGELNRVPPAPRPQSGAEELCRQVIAYAEGEARGGAGETAAAARLQKELEGLLAEGPLRLPAPSARAEALLEQARARLPRVLRGAGRD